VALAMPCSLAAASGPVSPAIPPELGEDGIVKSALVGSDLRISGVQISVCLTSDVRVNFWDPLKIVAATNNFAGTSADQFYSTPGGRSEGPRSRDQREGRPQTPADALPRLDLWHLDRRGGGHRLHVGPLSIQRAGDAERAGLRLGRRPPHRHQEPGLCHLGRPDGNQRLRRPRPRARARHFVPLQDPPQQVPGTFCWHQVADAISSRNLVPGTAPPLRCRSSADRPRAAASA